MYNTCVIKNIDSQNHIILGVEITPNSTYNIPDEKRVKASNNGALITKISSGLIQVGDGTTFFTDIGEQVNYLKSGISSISISEINTTVESREGVTGFKLSRSNVNIALSTSYQDLLSLTGSGEFFGLKTIFSNDKVNILLEIDGLTVFEIPVEELRQMNYESFSNAGLSRFFGGDQHGEFEFFPKINLKYTTSLKIKVKKTVSWNINNEFYHFFYCED